MSALTSSFVGVAPKVAAMKPKKAQRVAVTAKAVDVDSLAPPTTRVAPRVPEGARFSGSLGVLRDCAFAAWRNTLCASTSGFAKGHARERRQRRDGAIGEPAVMRFQRKKRTFPD
jgi:hypothetical protein